MYQNLKLPRKVITKLQAIKRSEQCLAGGVNLMSDVNGIIGLAQGMLEMEGPSEQYVKQANEFYKTCLTKLVNFYPAKDVAGGMVGKGGLMFAAKKTALWRGGFGSRL